MCRNPPPNHRTDTAQLEGNRAIEPFSGLQTLSISTQTDIKKQRPLMTDQVEAIATVLMGETISSFELNERIVKSEGPGDELDCCDQGELTWIVTKQGQQVFASQRNSYE